MEDYLLQSDTCAKLIVAGKHDEASTFLVAKVIPARNSFLEPVSAEQKRQAKVMEVDLKSI
jgi:hypothetical protein